MTHWWKNWLDFFLTQFFQVRKLRPNVLVILFKIKIYKFQHEMIYDIQNRFNAPSHFIKIFRTKQLEIKDAFNL